MAIQKKLKNSPKHIQSKSGLIEGLLQFLEKSPTPFHVAENVAEILRGSGFKELDESTVWNFGKKGRYFLIKGGATLIAVNFNNETLRTEGFNIIGAHTDSPCLKIKPIPENNFREYVSLGVEVYGGVILSSWFDRDLSIAGKIVYTHQNGSQMTTLLDFKRPLAVIPNLAIHLSRNPKKSEINKQTEILPIFFQKLEEKEVSPKISLNEILKIEANKTLEEKFKVDEILCHDLYLYDVQPPLITGYNGEFISGSKLDNLLSCYISLQSFIDSDCNTSSVLVCFNFEEIGSQAFNGASGGFLKGFFERMINDREQYFQALSKSKILSVDNAHGVHPNYQDRYDQNHGPVINKGPVIKSNASQKYATNSELTGLFIRLCKKTQIPYQNFVNRSDLGCGSTIGPIVSASLGIPTMDIGLPTFAMHSIREICGSKDPEYLYSILKSFLNKA